MSVHISMNDFYFYVKKILKPKKGVLGTYYCCGILNQFCHTYKYRWKMNPGSVCSNPWIVINLRPIFPITEYIYIYIIHHFPILPLIPLGYTQYNALEFGRLLPEMLEYEYIYIYTNTVFFLQDFLSYKMCHATGYSRA